MMNKNEQIEAMAETIARDLCDIAGCYYRDDETGKLTEEGGCYHDIALTAMEYGIPTLMEHYTRWAGFDNGEPAEDIVKEYLTQ